MLRISQLSILNCQLREALIPIRSELPNHRLAEELPQRDAVAFAFAFGGHADTPLVIEDVGEAVFFD